MFNRTKFSSLPYAAWPARPGAVAFRTHTLTTKAAKLPAFGCIFSRFLLSIQPTLMKGQVETKKALRTFQYLLATMREFQTLDSCFMNLYIPFLV